MARPEPATTLNEILDAFPEAPIDHDNLDWYRGLLEDELRITHCRDCGVWHHPPGPRCPACWSDNVVAESVGGEGVVELHTVLHVGPPAEGIDYDAGHRLVSVRLDGAPGVRVTAPVAAAEAHTIGLGTRVELHVADRAGTPTVVVRPVGGQRGR